MGLKSIASMVDSKRDTILGFDRYMVEDGVRTLQQAKRIESDPMLMKAVQLEAERQKEALSSITKKQLVRRKGGV
jgi:hypothetical protein